jgi:hypothetical protein
MGTTEGPAPGLAPKPMPRRPLIRVPRRLDPKRRRRAVEALIGEEEADDGAPAPSVDKPPPVPLPAAGPEPVVDAPPWATVLMQQMADLQAQVTELKGGKPTPGAAPGVPPSPAQPPVVPSVPRQDNVPPRPASAASAAVAEDGRPSTAQILEEMGVNAPTGVPAIITPPSPVADLVETAADAPVGASLMAAGLPPPAPENTKFHRPGGIS